MCPSQNKAHGVQKKAYRVLEEVCASPQGPGAHFVQSHLDDLKKTLLGSLRSTSSPAKRVRALGPLALLREEG
jgi:ribosomal RNA-processing protein 12